MEDDEPSSYEEEAGSAFAAIGLQPEAHASPVPIRTQLSDPTLLDKLINGDDDEPDESTVSDETPPEKTASPPSGMSGLYFVCCDDIQSVC